MIQYCNYVRSCFNGHYLSGNEEECHRVRLGDHIVILLIVRYEAGPRGALWMGNASGKSKLYGSITSV